MATCAPLLKRWRSVPVPGKRPLRLDAGTTAGREARSQLSPCPRPCRRRFAPVDCSTRGHVEQRGLAENHPVGQRRGRSIPESHPPVSDRCMQLPAKDGGLRKQRGSVPVPDHPPSHVDVGTTAGREVRSSALPETINPRRANRPRSRRRRSGLPGSASSGSPSGVMAPDILAATNRG